VPTIPWQAAKKSPSASFPSFFVTAVFVQVDNQITFPWVNAKHFLKNSGDYSRIFLEIEQKNG